MKKSKSYKLALPILLSAAMTSVVASQTTQSSEQYTVTVLNDCKVMGEMNMNSDQVSSYLSLKQAETYMTQLQAPIEKIEIEIEKLSENIEVLSESSFKYTDKTFHINKEQINKQNKAVAQLNKLIANHQKDFDAIGQQGHKIEKLAREFAFTINDNFKNIEFNSIRVSGPNLHNTNTSCNSFS